MRALRPGTPTCAKTSSCSMWMWSLTQAAKLNILSNVFSNSEKWRRQFPENDGEMFNSQTNGAFGRPHKIRIAIDPGLLEAEMHSPLSDRQKVRLIGSPNAKWHSRDQ